MTDLPDKLFKKAMLASHLNQTKIPPDEWAKRLVKVSQSSMVALDQILEILDRFNDKMTAQQAARLATELAELTMEPMKPRPRKFRGKQCPKWPYPGWNS